MGLPMEQVVSECGNCDVDLESGEAIVDSKVSDESRLSLSDAYYGLGNCDNFMQCEEKVTVSKATDYSDNSLESIWEKKLVKEKPKAMSAKKPPKPPRPPRGLSLDSADEKIIRELAEMAKLKRARMERMKALKKMKDAKTSSSKNQLFATLFTIMFCLVILFQGISSRTGSAATFQGSPTTSRATNGGIIPMAYLQSLPVTGSDSHSLMEQISVTNAQEENTRVAH